MSYFGTAGDRTVAAMRDIVYDDCPVLLTSPATGGVVSDNFPVLGRHPLGKFVKTILLIQKLSLPLAVLWAYREELHTYVITGATLSISVAKLCLARV